MTQVIECDNKDCKYWIHDDTCTRNKIKVEITRIIDERDHPICVTEV